MADTTDAPPRPLFAWGRWTSLFCAFSYLMLGADAAMNHHKVIETNRLSWTPLFFAPVAVALCLTGVFSAVGRRRAWIVGLLGLAVGGAGELLHLYFDLAEVQDITLWQALLNASRPPLAPAAFASTGILMLLVALAERWPVRWRRKASE